MDMIGNFLTCIRNALARSKPSVVVPYSRIKQQIANLLKAEGFIRDVHVTENERNHKQLLITLRYVDGESAIHKIVRVSTPGRPVYEKSTHMPSVAGGFGIAVLSTNRGIITNKQAREFGIGGAILCAVW
jgi:small subunit ribosomal protein S8